MSNSSEKYNMSVNAVNEVQRKTFEYIEKLGENSMDIYKVLCQVQDILDNIRGVPDENRIIFQEIVKEMDQWKQQANEILKEFKKKASNTDPGFNGIEPGILAGVSAPNIAAGLATTFETTTLAIMAPVLGGSVAAGVAFALSLAPIFDPFTAIATVLLLKAKNDEKQQIERLFTRINNRNIKMYDLSCVELNVRLEKMQSEKIVLQKMTKEVEPYGTDYSLMTEKQKYELGALYQQMLSTTQLLVNPILGLQPQYTENDYKSYLRSLELEIDVQEKALKQNSNQLKNIHRSFPDNVRFYTDKTYSIQKIVSLNVQINEYKELCNDLEFCENNKKLLISLCNLLYRIEMNKKDRKLLSDCLKRNKEFLDEYGLKGKYVNKDLVELVCSMLSIKYNFENAASKLV